MPHTGQRSQQLCRREQRSGGVGLRGPPAPPGLSCVQTAARPHVLGSPALLLPTGASAAGIPRAAPVQGTHASCGNGMVTGVEDSGTAVPHADGAGNGPRCRGCPSHRAGPQPGSMPPWGRRALPAPVRSRSRVPMGGVFWSRGCHGDHAVIRSSPEGKKKKKEKSSFIINTSSQINPSHTQRAQRGLRPAGIDAPPACCPVPARYKAPLPQPAVSCGTSLGEARGRGCSQ